MGQAHLSNSFLDFILKPMAAAAAGTVASIVVARALSAPVVTSPEAGLQVIDGGTKQRCKPEEEWDERLKLCKAKATSASAAVYSPEYVQGDQVKVDVGTLLQEIDFLLKHPERMGEVNPETQKVLDVGVPL